MMNYTNKLFIGLLLVIFLGALSNLYGQTGDPEATFARYKSLYPDEQAIYLVLKQHMNISMANDSLMITTSHYEEMLHLGENSKPYAQGKIYSSSFIRVSQLDAKTLVPAKKKYEVEQVKEFKESFDKDSNIFYDDVKYINFLFPAIQPGARTQLLYTEKVTDPHFLGQYRPATFIPVIESEFVVTIDDGIDINFYTFHGFEDIYSREEKSIGGKRIFRFSGKNIPKIKFEANSPSLSYDEPHLIPVIRSFTSSENEKVKVLSSLQDLYSWYRGFIHDLKKEDPSIKGILDSIVNPEDTELEKVRKVFYWVQDNIKYIAFEQGMRGLIPHPGSYVLNNRYGDCKGMSSIIISMLHQLGIDAKFAWIGSRDLPYKYSQLPSPMVDNHMIAAYQHGKDWIFLDATGQYIPFGYPTSMIQGKEALVAVEEDHYELVTVPVQTPSESIMSDSYTYSIEKGMVKGEGKLQLTGHARVFNAYKMIKSNKTSVDNYVNRLLSRGSNKFFVDNYQIAHLDNRDEPIALDYQFRVEDYYRTTGSQIFFNMNMDKGMAGSTIKPDRVHSLDNEYQYVNSSEAIFNIPEGYAVSFVPQDSGIDTDIFSYKITYTQEANRIVQKRDYQIKYLQLHPQQFPVWNEAIKHYSESMRQVVILSKKETE
ncbi:MAG: DUF3857 domain-containing protein [Imperialibacter sp.]|uniref:DUF3857 domain-containing protein n=1 Tax=Imperialibacter sp. TaxID=2038411 RepID=UPI003A8B29F4